MESQKNQIKNNKNDLEKEITILTKDLKNKEEKLNTLKNNF